MTNPNYSLEIISHHSQFQNKSLRKYSVDGIDTVGAWGDEPFEIRFTNHTWNKIQVKISLDGTDVFTGEPATTEPTKDMWVVEGYGVLSLKAWPETNNGGASFIFTSANNSVAVHTHGDLSSRGIVAAAVFTEGYVEPVRLNPYPVYPIYPTYPVYSTPIWYNNYTFDGVIANNVCNTGGTFGGGGGTYSSCAVPCSTTTQGNTTMDVTLGETVSLESLVAAGAGQYVDQKITYVKGLTKPTFSETVRVRYMWWDDLVAKLKQASVPSPQPSGFPGDKRPNNIDLKDTPRKEGSFKRSAQPEVAYQRI